MSEVTYLGDSGRKERLFLDAVLPALLDDTLVDCGAHLGHLLPGEGGFERFGDKVVLKTEVAQVPDHEGQEVTSLTILSACPETLVLLSESVDYLHLVGDFVGSALEKHSAESHFVRVEFHDLSDEVFFSSIDRFVQLAFLLSLEGHAELELVVVHEPQTSRPHLRL